MNQALKVFWTLGYDTASVALLREAMGISAASFYAAFTSKESLFEVVMQRYMSSYGQATAPAANEDLPPRTAIEQTLTNSVQMQTDPSHPPGCLLVLSATTCSPANTHVHRLLKDKRAEDRRNISRCVERAVQAGELPRDTRHRALGAMFHNFVIGITVQARDGVPRQNLFAAAHYAMLAWESPAAAPANP